MKSAKILVIKLAVLLLIAGVPYLYLVGNRIMSEDTFYWKTTSSADHLIIGGSRSQKGISPAILSQELELEGHFINLAFTLVNSPYGSYYNYFIKRKLNSVNRDKTSVFILEVTSGLMMDFEEERFPRERDFRIYDLFMVNQHPNIEYFIRNSNARNPTLKELLQDNPRLEHLGIHRDGWVEYLGQRDTLIPLEDLRVYAREFVRSPEREDAFIDLVSYLKARGEVVLVRLPIHPDVAEVEDFRSPFFIPFIEKIADRQGVHFIDYSGRGENFEYFDQYHHLTGKSAREFSHLLARDIRSRVQ